MLKIIKTRLWKHPKIVLAILLNSPPLDATVILFNPKTYLLIKNKETLSFLTIRKHSTFYEIKSVYTFPKHRKRHYASKLIKYLLKKQTNIGILCKKEMEEFYNKLGFKKTKDIFKIKKLLLNMILSEKNKIIAMKT